ncbi:MAG: ABC transporter permease, partial [Aestuariivirgaceae bacterium]
MSQYIALSYWDVVLAAIFLLINGCLSLWLDLRLERQLFVSAVRMVVQLILIGFILKALFAISSPWLTGLVALAMGMF